MTEQTIPIPSFEAPPVIEVVWGIQFRDLQWLTSSGAGVFWTQIRDDYPVCEEQPTIPHVIESDRPLAPTGQTIQFGDVPPMNRQWYISPSGTELIQLQRDRFLFNWRKVEDSDTYPRYDYMKEKFSKSWERFCAFVNESGHELSEIDQCEMTYINHFPKGDIWTAPAEIAGAFRPFTWPSDVKFLPSPLSLGQRLIFDPPGTPGRLHVTLKHGTTGNGDGTELFVLELTARGLPESTETEGLFAWFASVREWIDRGFADLTSETMHERWRREL